MAAVPDVLVPPLIDVAALQARLGDPRLRIVDARFDLADPGAGEAAWRAARLPGARYAHLDRDLSDHARPASEGRHPLPSPERFAATLASWDISPRHHVVVHDASSGAMAAARLWWMLRWMGMDHVQVLDGGWAAWLAAGAPVDRGVPPEVPLGAGGAWTPREAMRADAADVRTRGAASVLVDLRAAERYRGDVEPLDRRAGHIPGARNRPFAASLQDGRFKPPARLAEEWGQVFEGRHAADAIVYCGSGVTACHGLLAIAAAGLPLPRLYAPSWSGWSSDPDAPIATGDD